MSDKEKPAIDRAIEALGRAMELTEELGEMVGEKITPNPEYDALHAFDAENNFGPIRETAERIAAKYGVDWRHPMVDDISHALEDMLDLGQRRAAYLPKAVRH